MPKQISRIANFIASIAYHFKLVN